MPNRHFLRSDIFIFAMVYYFYFRLFSPNESNSKKILLVKQALSLYTKEKISKEDLHNEKY